LLCAVTATPRVSAQSFNAESVAAAERRAADEQPAWLQKLCMLLSVPSVSSDPARRKDVMEAATRTAGLMTEAGLENVETSYFPTGQGHVVVYGDWLHAPPGAPTVLIYNHFDVQPEDPIDGWKKGHAAFPEAMHECIKDGHVLGRGASDNKGGLVGVLAAVAAVMKSAG
jgi:acetylornithine deacetylase/succinyl-diaminopimelate desuccinylase-like protein